MRRTSVYVQNHNHIEVNEMKPHEAARLYGELKEKAEKEVISAALEKAGAHNEVKVLRFSSEPDYASADHKVHMVFTVNGQEYKLDAKADWRSQMNRSILAAVFEDALKQMNSFEASRLLTEKKV